MDKKCSIVIPTKDKNSRLYLTLKCLEPQMDENSQIVVVFDGCSKETLDEFNTFKWKMNVKQVISENNVGRSAARNLGLKAADGDVVIFLDDDRLTEKDFIKKHMAHHTDKRCVALGERFDAKVPDEKLLKLMKEDRLSEVLASVKQHAKKEFYYVIKKWFVKNPYGKYRFMTFITGNVSIDRDLLLEIGGFDDNYKGWGYEDTDIGYRIVQKNIPYIQDDSIVCYHLYHPHNRTTKSKEELANLKYLKAKFPDDITLGKSIKFYTLKATLKL